MAGHRAHYHDLIQWLAGHPGLAAWADQLPDQIDRGLSRARWGDLPQWQAALDTLPDLAPSSVELERAVRIGRAEDCEAATRTRLREALMALHPWRKGPFDLFGLHIETEWRSDWKWERLKDAIGSLENQVILDVGCGNGYHCLRMAGAGATRVIGIDPSPRFVFQFRALKHFIPSTPVDVLPMGIEHMPPDLYAFDSVFSMGVIYHRRDPEAHVRELAGCLKPGGLMVLETLVVNEAEGPLLVPEKRYARMRNVWGVPAPSTVQGWLQNAGLKDIQIVDVSPTTVQEQRATDWMQFHSLADFLDPDNPSRTVEGYPAPVRGIFTART